MRSKTPLSKKRGARDPGYSRSKRGTFAALASTAALTFMGMIPAVAVAAETDVQGDAAGGVAASDAALPPELQEVLDSTPQISAASVPQSGQREQAAALGLDSPAQSDDLVTPESGAPVNDDVGDGASDGDGSSDASGEVADADDADSSTDGAQQSDQPQSGAKRAARGDHSDGSRARHSRGQGIDQRSALKCWRNLLRCKHGVDGRGQI